MRFSGSFIFNNLPSSKMAVHPCTAHRPLKNAIFQWSVRMVISDAFLHSKMSLSDV